jgi:hypothetical protein
MKRLAILVALGLSLAGCVYGPGYGPGYYSYGPGYYGYAPAYGAPMAAPSTTRGQPNGAFGG